MTGSMYGIIAVAVFVLSVGIGMALAAAVSWWRANG